MIVTVMYGVVREGMTSRSGIIQAFYVLECAHETRPCSTLRDEHNRGAAGGTAGAAAERYRVARLRWRSAQPALFTAQPDRRRELQQSGSCLAFQDRRARPAPGVQARRDA